MVCWWGREETEELTNEDREDDPSDGSCWQYCSLWHHQMFYLSALSLWLLPLMSPCDDIRDFKSSFHVSFICSTMGRLKLETVNLQYQFSWQEVKMCLLTCVTSSLCYLWMGLLLMSSLWTSGPAPSNPVHTCSNKVIKILISAADRQKHLSDWFTCLITCCLLVSKHLFGSSKKLWISG